MVSQDNTSGDIGAITWVSKEGAWIGVFGLSC